MVVVTVVAVVVVVVAVVEVSLVRAIAQQLQYEPVLTHSC